MDAEHAVERLRAFPGSEQITHLAGFDPSNDVHLDEAARLLLDRFRRCNDVEAFTLLFELTQERLSQIAAQITRRFANGTDPDDLLATFMARLFADVRGRSAEQVRRFLALAHTSMRNEVYDQMRQQKRAATGARRYQDTLRPPNDPADEAQDGEESDLLERYGRILVELTVHCFHQLDKRDKNVLVAREILGLSYDRVAAMLHLEPEQVGMIIRRARQHLADRLVQELPEADDEMATGALDATRALIRRCLESRDRIKNVRTLVQRMLDASAEAGRRRLADLVYELAKACLLDVPGLGDRTLVSNPPRQRAVVAGDLMDMAQRLRGVSADVEVPDFSRPRGAATALDEAQQCLEALEQIEGPSGRQQVAVALTAIYGGQLAEGESILRSLMTEDLPPVTRQNVYRNLVLTLLRQERWREALQIAVEAADEWPDDPVRITNICFAAARLGDVQLFQTNVRKLAEFDRREPSERVRAWIEGEMPGLADDLGIPRARLADLTTTGLGRDGTAS